MTNDLILIKDLMLRAIIGVNDWEREQKQDLLINITLQADLNAAGRSDSIDDTVNYRTITKKVIAHVEHSERFTVEALAQDIADLCLEQKGVIRATVRLEKPSALRFARSVGVEIVRERSD